MEDLIEMMRNGEAQIDALIACGDLHVALAQARFLEACGHPRGAELVTKAQRAIWEHRQRAEETAQVSAPV